MEAKDTITLVVGILAFVGVVATIVVASWTATSSANADRALQTRTQLRQAALAPLDKLREQLNDRIRDRQGNWRTFTRTRTLWFPSMRSSRSS